MKTFADAETKLAASLPGYEPRPHQQRLARAIEGAIATKRHLIGEAGTGVGKSLAYLIPAILSGKRVVVATATKALQSQIATKDAPFLAEHLGIDFSFAVLKGRSNYLCRNRLVAAEVADDVRAALSERASEEDFSGEREDLGFDIDDRDWREVASNSDVCFELGCKSLADEHGRYLCFAQQAKARAAAASVVVANHALLATDLLVREVSDGYANLLGEYDVLVIDECHEFQEYVTSSLGGQISQGSFRTIAAWARNLGRDLDVEVDGVLTTLLGAVDELWDNLEDGRLYPAHLLGDPGFEVVAKASFELLDTVDRMVGKAADERTDKRARTLLARVRTLADRWFRVVTAPPDEFVRWVETERARGRGEDRKVVRYAPIVVGPYLAEHLWPNCTAILVSATVMVDNRADYVAGWLGLTDYDELDVGTPFDYHTQAMLYIPSHLPEPSQRTRQQWSVQMRETIVELVEASRGRALLLFTSYREMAACYDAIAHRLNYVSRKQGDAPHRVLYEWFAENTDSVLFATKSFFTGIDVAGESCSLVVLDKLPFAVPTDPMVEARCEAIERDGGNVFREFTIPEMVLPLKQGFGRLIRRSTDRGTVSILDPRLVKKGYGKTILRSLPPARRTETIDDVKGFFAAETTM